jgi:hypothetical protein
MPDINMMGGDMMGADRPLSMPGNDQRDNHEAAMARADLYKCANYSFKLFKMIQEGQELEGWVQAKITKAADYIASVYHYMEYEMKFNDYGKKLEDSDIYTEAVKQEFVQKLTEARVKLEKLKRKNIKDLDEGSKPDFLDMDKDGDKKEPMKQAIRQKRTKPVKEASKPDFLDMDKDGDKKEPMKQAIRQKRTKPVEEASTGDYSAKKARAGKDIGKPGKQFSKIATSAGKQYGSKERGETVAGAVLAKLRKK